MPRARTRRYGAGGPSLSLASPMTLGRICARTFAGGLRGGRKRGRILIGFSPPPHREPTALPHASLRSNSRWAWVECPPFIPSCVWPACTTRRAPRAPRGTEPTCSPSNLTRPRYMAVTYLTHHQLADSSHKLRARAGSQRQHGRGLARVRRDFHCTMPCRFAPIPCVVIAPPFPLPDGTTPRSSARRPPTKQTSMKCFPRCRFPASGLHEPGKHET